MILVVGLTVDGTGTVTFEAGGPVKVTLTMRAQDVGCQFVSSPSTGTESHFLGESFGGLLSTMYASSGIGPLFTSLNILTGQRQATCRDDGSRTAPTGVVPGHLDHGLFHLFDTNV